MGRRLPIEVINQIKLRLDLDEYIPDIAVALGLSKTTVYKLQLNWDLWGRPYAPPSVKLGRLGVLLEYQKQVSIHSIVLSFLLIFLPTYSNYLSTLKRGLLRILMRYKTSSLTNLISKPLLPLFAIFLRQLSSLKRWFLNMPLSKAHHSAIYSRVGRKNSSPTSLSFLISRL